MQDRLGHFSILKMSRAINEEKVFPRLAFAGAGFDLGHVDLELAKDGDGLVQGAGAGAGPTAAAVAADIADVMTGARRPVFQAPAPALRFVAPVDGAHAIGRAYVRLLVRDEPGVIASITETLAEAGVSIDSFLQKPIAGVGGVPIVLTTHLASESVLTDAVGRIAALPSMLEAPRLIRIARI